MGGSIYLVALVCCSLLVGFGTAFGMRKWGGKGLLGAASLITVLLLVLGYVDYHAQPVKETPLSAYLLGSVCSTLLAALAVALIARRGLGMLVQGALGGLVWLGTTWLIILWTVFI